MKKRLKGRIGYFPLVMSYAIFFTSLFGILLSIVLDLFMDLIIYNLLLVAIGIFMLVYFGGKYRKIRANNFYKDKHPK